MQEPVETKQEVAYTAAAPPPPPPAAPSMVRTRVSRMPYGFRARQFVLLAIFVVDAILGLRFLFLAFEANNVGFVAAMDQAGAALAYPFRGIFGTTFVLGGHPMQWVDIVAMGVYTVAAWVVSRLILILAVPGDRNRNAPVV